MVVTYGTLLLNLSRCHRSKQDPFGHQTLDECREADSTISPAFRRPNVSRKPLPAIDVH
jgi:hypothetical protein